MTESDHTPSNLDADDFNTLRAESLFSLSSTQARVSYFVAMGLTRDEIATEMEIGAETVKTHECAIYDRVGRHLGLKVNRSNLRSIFVENKILDTPTDEE